MMATMKQILLKEWNHPPLFSSSMVYTTVDGLNVGPTTLDEDYPMNYGVLCVYLSGGYIAVLDSHQQYTILWQLNHQGELVVNAIAEKIKHIKTKSKKT